MQMFDDDLNQRKSDDRGPKKPAGGFNIPTFTWVAWIAIIGCIAAWMLLHSRLTPPAGAVDAIRFFQKFRVESDCLAPPININQQMPDTAEISGSYYKTDKDGKVIEPKVEVPFIVPKRANSRRA